MHSFGGPTLRPTRGCSVILVRWEAQNLSKSIFSCMLIPFLMFLLYSDEGKVKYSPIWTGIQSDDFGRSPFLIRIVGVRKDV